MNNWNEILFEPMKTVLAQMGQFAVGVLLVLLILCIGWIIAKVIRAVVVKLLKMLKLDGLSDQIGLKGVLKKGGIESPLSVLVGGICYWLVFLITFVVALNAVGLTIAADLLQRIALFLPNIIVAIFILIIGMFTAVIMKNIVKTTGSNAGIPQVDLLSKITQVSIMIFAGAMALGQLQIGAQIIELTIAIILGSLGLGLALAVGLGCKDIVRDLVKDYLDKPSK